MLCEQVMNLLQGGDASSGTPVEMPVIEKMVEQLINANLKADYFSTHLANGETIPDGAMLATYEKILIEKYKGVFSRIKMPAIPISLPLNMGYYFIGPHVSNDSIQDPVLTATPAGPTSIILTWTAIQYATQYYVAKSIDAVFTAPIPLYSGPLLTFTSIGLTASTQYWYRITASAVGYNDSNTIQSSAVTTA